MTRHFEVNSRVLIS